jgi:hypothetical protein
MIVTTTNAVEGRRVTDYLGVVHGCAVMGSNLFRDFFAGIRDIVGGRVASYETVLKDAKDVALADLMARAEGDEGRCDHRRQLRPRFDRRRQQDHPDGERDRDRRPAWLTLG